METDKNPIDEYIQQFDGEKQEKLQEICGIIRQVLINAAPNTTEKYSWEMPTFYLHGNLVHFALHKSHIGFYPGASGVSAFEGKLGTWKHSKGAIQFPLNQPLPEKLIQEIVLYRVHENMDNYMEKQKKKQDKKQQK